MYFKVEYSLAPLEIDVDQSRPLQFNYVKPHPSTVTLSWRFPEGQKSIDRLADVLCTVHVDRDVSGKLRIIFESLAANRLPQGSQTPDRTSSVFGDPYSYIDPQGNIAQGHVAPWELLPQAYKAFVSEVVNELDTYVRKTIRVLRWRCDISGPHNPVRSIGLTSWSFDGKLWMQLTREASVILSSHLVPRITDAIRDEVMQMVEAGVSEPIAHELYREAWEQRSANPRSALIIGIAAVEVGVKQYVSTVLPQAQWLVDHLPSPPVVPILEEYVPKLASEGASKVQQLLIPQELLQTLKKGVKLRNDLVHSSARAPSHGTLQEVLGAVEDVLWILDYLCGFDWALQYVRPDTRSKLNLTLGPASSQTMLPDTTRRH
jgi:hypothetical protein